MTNTAQVSEAKRQAIAQRQRAQVAAASGEDGDRPPVPPPPPMPVADDVAAETRPSVPRGVPVAFLRFVDRSMQISGMQSGEQLKAERATNGREHRIEYIPEIRHHLITYLDHARGTAAHDLVHEAQVKSWKPALPTA